jgi:hypothetical protein
MSNRNIGRRRWRWLCGALAVAGTVIILAWLAGEQRLRAEALSDSEPPARHAGIASGPQHESEAGEGDVSTRDYFDTLKRAAPAGIPSLARTRAIAAMQSMPALSGPATWTFIGPESINNGQGMSSSSVTCNPTRLTVSGRVTALAFGKDPSTIYLGSALGGLWKSTDSASTWKPLLDQQPSMAVGALAVVPGTPDTVYVGTGEGNNATTNSDRAS